MLTKSRTLYFLSSSDNLTCLRAFEEARLAFPDDSFVIRGDSQATTLCLEMPAETPDAAVSDRAIMIRAKLQASRWHKSGPAEQIYTVRPYLNLDAATPVLKVLLREFPEYVFAIRSDVAPEDGGNTHNVRIVSIWPALADPTVTHDQHMDILRQLREGHQIQKETEARVAERAASVERETVMVELAQKYRTS